MTRIFYRSSAGLALATAIAGVAVMLGNHQGGRTPAAKAPGTRSPAATTSMPPATALQFTAASPTVENVHRSITQPAHVEAYERTDLYAKASGFVAKVYADIGEQVEQDQILAELWIPEMEQEQRLKAALIEQARAVVEQAQARLASSEALIAEAEARLAETQATIEQYEAEVAFRLSEHRRISELVASRAVTESLQDEKLKQLKASESALAAARAQVQSAQARIHVEHARKLQAQADVAHARSQLKVAETELRYTQILMQYAQIRAPYAGVISNRSADTGDFVASAAGGNSVPLFTIDRVDRLRIVFDVPETESAQIQIGQLTSLSVDALKGRTFPGRIARTAGVLDPRTRTLRVEAELLEHDPALRPGMFGMIGVTLSERSKALLPPSRGSRFQEKQPYVFCVNGRAVEIGFTDGTRTEIVCGASPNDRIVLESRHSPHPGHSLQIADLRE